MADCDRTEPPPGDLTHLGEVAALLTRFGLEPDKGFGQNFLVGCCRRSR